jgi:cytochrome c peroxidase
MSSSRWLVVLGTAVLCGVGPALTFAAAPPPPPPPPPLANGSFPDPSGLWSNLVRSNTQTNTPFFQSLGSNGRTCATCHAPADAWTVTPGHAQQRFQASNGTDPLFASLDGTNCPSLKTTSLADRQAASSLLLKKGLIRVALTPPAQSQFTVTAVTNPYGCTSTASVSVYRRILPTANLPFTTTVMWDGRESASTTSVSAALAQQARSAILGHAAATSTPTTATLAAILSQEIGIFSAQTSDNRAGSLSAGGAKGGVTALSQQSFTPGGNDPFGPSAPAPGVTPSPVFSLFGAWASLAGTSPAAQAQASIARGEKIFNTRPMTLRGVAGLTDQKDRRGLPLNVVTGTCGTCHNAPNVGGNTLGRLFDTGVSRPESQAGDLPVITLRNKTTGAQVQTTDPGFALTSGLWSDVNKFKTPGLRNLAARGPYFHNGSAGSLEAVVNFYNNRFGLNLSSQERADLIAFLASL